MQSVPDEEHCQMQCEAQQQLQQAKAEKAAAIGAVPAGAGGPGRRTASGLVNSAYLQAAICSALRSFLFGLPTSSSKLELAYYGRVW